MSDTARSRAQQRRWLKSEVKTLTSLISDYEDPESSLPAMCLMDRLEDVEKELAELGEDFEPEHVEAFGELVFKGKPVHQDKGILAAFGADSVRLLQRMVTKIHKAIHDVSKFDVPQLYITGVVHGSFGFVFEEFTPPGENFDMFQSVLSEDIGRLLVVLHQIQELDIREMESLRVEYGSALFAALQAFFSHLDKHGATFSISTEQADIQYERGDIEKAVAATVPRPANSERFIVKCEYKGILPEKKDFEMHVVDADWVGDRLLTGKVPKRIRPADIEMWNSMFVNKEVYLSFDRVTKKQDRERTNNVLVSVWDVKHGPSWVLARMDGPPGPPDEHLAKSAAGGE